MAKRKRKAGFPRLFVQAVSRRDLLDFVESVNKLGVMVDDLHAALNRMEAKKKKKPTPPAAAPKETQP